MRPHVHVVPFLKGPGQRFLLKDWLAITIGSHIFAWRALDPVERSHEEEHARQWEKNGLLYVPRYFLSSWRAKRKGMDRYWDNEFEVEARTAATRMAAVIAAWEGGGT